MNEVVLVAYRQRVNALFARSSVFDADPELLSHWAKYICVLVSGYLETALKHYFCEFSRNKSHPYICSFTMANLEDFMNPKMEKILQLTGAFSKDWKKELEAFVEGERKDAVDSIVANRNNIAHGRNVSLTLVRMKKYFEKALEVTEFIKRKVEVEL